MNRDDSYILSLAVPESSPFSLAFFRAGFTGAASGFETCEIRAAAGGAGAGAAAARLLDGGAGRGRDSLKFTITFIISILKFNLFSPEHSFKDGTSDRTNSSSSSCPYVLTLWSISLFSLRILRISSSSLLVCVDSE